MARRFRVLFLIVSSAMLLAQAASAEGGKTVRVLIGQDPFLNQFERELQLIVSEYNRLNSDQKVVLQKKGKGFSALRSLVAAKLAGDLPDIAFVEAAEVQAAGKAGLGISLDKAGLEGLLKGMPPWMIEDSRDGRGRLNGIPLSRSLPVLFVNQEILFRNYLDPFNPPGSWPELVRTGRALSAKTEGNSGQTVLEFPMQGESGVWLTEALTNEHLWHENGKETRAAPGIEPLLDRMAGQFSRARWIGSDKTPAKAVEKFLRGESYVMAGFTHLMPYIASRADFRWVASPLPLAAKDKGISQISSGSQILVLREGAGARKFLTYLYRPDIALRWCMAGGFFPLKKAWRIHPKWRETERRIYGAHSGYSTLLTHLGYSEKWSPIRLRLRSTSPNVIQLRSDWALITDKIFSKATGRGTAGPVLNQWAQTMKARGSR